MQKTRLHIIYIAVVTATAFLFRYLAVHSKAEAELHYQATGAQLENPHIVRHLLNFYYFFSVYHTLLVLAAIILMYAYIKEYHKRQQNPEVNER